MQERVGLPIFLLLSVFDPCFIRGSKGIFFCQNQEVRSSNYESRSPQLLQPSQALFSASFPQDAPFYGLFRLTDSGNSLHWMEVEDLSGAGGSPHLSERLHSHSH